MPGLSAAQISDLFLAACRAELDALKPGNVHVHAAGHGMQVAQFEASAAASAPFIAAAGVGVGARILGAVEASFAAAGCNTNLGILLLCAPLAAAGWAAGVNVKWRAAISQVQPVKIQVASSLAHYSPHIASWLYCSRP